MRAVFNVTDTDLVTGGEISQISAGADMIMIPLANHTRLAQLNYDLQAGADLLNAHGVVGAYFIWKESDNRYHVRMAFPTGGIFEDPATGAAAAALSGSLPDTGQKTGEITIIQAEDAGATSRLTAVSTPEIGAPVRVMGATRRLVRRASEPKLSPRWPTRFRRYLPNSADRQRSQGSSQGLLLLLLRPVTPKTAAPTGEPTPPRAQPRPG